MKVELDIRNGKSCVHCAVVMIVGVFITISSKQGLEKKRNHALYPYTNRVLCPKLLYSWRQI